MMRNYLPVLVWLIILSACGRYVAPPQPPVPEASLKKKWVNDRWERHEANRYLRRGSHRITRKKTAIWVDGYRTSSSNGSRYVPGHWR